METHQDMDTKHEEKYEKISNHILNFILNRKESIIIPLLILALLVAIWVDLDYAIINKNNAINEKRIEFFSATDNILSETDSISQLDISTLKTVFNSIDRKTNGLLFKYGFINLLEDYYKYKIDSIKAKNKTNHTQLILKTIKKELDQEPYTQLFPEQRRILTNLNNSITKGDSTFALASLQEMNDILRIENEHSKKLENQNAWSIPLSIVGSILTLVFGLLALSRKNTSPKVPNK